MSQSASVTVVDRPWKGQSLYQVGILPQATGDHVCPHGQFERILVFDTGFCNCLLENVFYQILFCFLVTFCKCVEGSCFRPAGHQAGMPTVGMAVGILLTTFLVIGEYNFSDSRIPVGLRNPHLRVGLRGWSGGRSLTFQATARNIQYQQTIRLSQLRAAALIPPATWHWLVGK